VIRRVDDDDWERAGENWGMSLWEFCAQVSKAVPAFVYEQLGCVREEAQHENDGDDGNDGERRGRSVADVVVSIRDLFSRKDASVIARAAARQAHAGADVDGDGERSGRKVKKRGVEEIALGVNGESDEGSRDGWMIVKRRLFISKGHGVSLGYDGDDDDGKESDEARGGGGDDDDEGRNGVERAVKAGVEKTAVALERARQLEKWLQAQLAIGAHTKTF